MTELSGREVELYAVAEQIVAADNRAEILKQQSDAEIVAENQAYRAELESYYRDGEFAKATEQLADVLGSRWSIDRHRQLRLPDGGYYPDVIAMPVLLGARKVSIDWAAGAVNPTDVLAMHGEVVYYRSVQEPPTAHNEEETYYNRFKRWSEYDERGFFCVMVQPKPTEHQTAAPVLCFGDLDDVAWNQPADKLLLAQMLGYDPTLTPQWPKDLNTDAYLLSTTSRYEDRQGLLFRKHIFQGILRDHQQVWMEEGAAISKHELEAAMQGFINKWYLPVQTKPEVAAVVAEAIPRARQEFIDNPYTALTFDTVHALKRYSQDEKGKQRPIKFLQPEVVIPYGYEWTQLQRKFEEYPLFGELRRLAREADEREHPKQASPDVAYDDEQQRFAIVWEAVHGRPERVNERMKKIIKQLFDLLPRDTAEAGQYIHDTLMMKNGSAIMNPNE